MLNKTRLIVLLVVLLFVAACATLESGIVLPSQHPSAADLGAQPKNCIECHEGAEPVPFARFVHTAYWADNHRQAAYQSAQVCGICHQQSYCNDCHATRVELKPSIKDQTDTYRRMPHRGDWLSRHRIEGRVDPTSCFRCHGNPKTTQTCAPCHG
jgi:hypothetical protein